MARTKKPETAAMQRIYDLLGDQQPVRAALLVNLVELLLEQGRDPALAILKTLEGLDEETREHVVTWMRGRFGDGPLRKLSEIVPLATTDNTALLPRDIGREPRAATEP